MLLGWWSDCQWCCFGLRCLLPKHRCLLLSVVVDTAEDQAQNQDQVEGDGQDHLTIRPGLGHEITWSFTIFDESAQSDWTVVGSKHAVTDGTLVLSPDMIREFVVQASELTE